MRNRIFAVLAIADPRRRRPGVRHLQPDAAVRVDHAAVAAPTQPVVVAAADLQLGTALKKEDLTTLNFPEGTAPAGSFSKPEELVERGLIVPS